MEDDKKLNTRRHKNRKGSSFGISETNKFFVHYQAGEIAGVAWCAKKLAWKKSDRNVKW